jgi:hypothetical protein
MTTTMPAALIGTNGRGGVRTCDLSRVKHDSDPDDEPPAQGTLF